MRTAIILLGIGLAIGWIVGQLSLNKQEINENARLAEQTVSTYPVKVNTVQNKSINDNWSISGNLAASKEMMVMTTTQGAVIEVYRKKGDRVKKGNLLVKVEDAYLKAEQKIIEANYEKAKKDLNRFQNLQEGAAITQQKLETIQVGVKEVEAKLEIVKKRIEDTAVKAPMSGVINQFFQKTGSVLGPGVPVCEIVNIDRLILKAKVTAQELTNIQLGDQFKVVTDIFPQDTLTGKVQNISVKSDASFQYDVEILVPNSSGRRILPGMYATAWTTRKIEAALTINQKAIQVEGDRNYVWVVEQGLAKTKDILVGENVGDLVIIRDGIKVGEQVVIQGANNLTENSKVQLIEN